MDHATCVPSAHLEWIAELRLVGCQGKLRTRVEPLRQHLFHQRLFVYSENQAPWGAATCPPAPERHKRIVRVYKGLEDRGT